MSMSQLTKLRPMTISFAADSYTSQICDARLVILYLGNVGLFASGKIISHTTSACIAAIYWSDMVFGHRGRVHVSPRLLRQLQAELRKEASNNQAEGNLQAGLRLWTLFVGAYAEENASG